MQAAAGTLSPDTAHDAAVARRGRAHGGDVHAHSIERASDAGGAFVYLPRTIVSPPMMLPSRRLPDVR
jgi:hypothetical protein